MPESQLAYLVGGRRSNTSCDKIDSVRKVWDIFFRREGLSAEERHLEVGQIGMECVNWVQQAVIE